MVYVNTDLFKHSSGSSSYSAPSSSPQITTERAPSPFAPPTGKQKFFGGVSKAAEKIGMLDKPQQWIQGKLSPLLFGTSDYKSGLEKTGLSPTMSGVAGFGMELLLDPLNLLFAAPVSKALGGIAKGALKPVGKFAAAGGDFIKGTKLAERFALKKSASLSDDVVKRLDDVLRLVPTTPRQYQDAIVEGIKLRKGIYSDKMIGDAAIDKFIRNVGGGKKLKNLDIDELADVFEGVKGGFGKEAKTLWSQKLPPGKQLAEGQQLLPGVRESFKATKPIAYANKTQFTVPKYMVQPLDTIAKVRKMDTDVNIIQKFFRPFWRTIESLDSTGTLKKGFYEPIEKSAIAMEKWVKSDITPFIAKTYGRMPKEGRIRVFKILDNASDEAAIKLYGKSIKANSKEINAAVKTRKLYNTMLDQANVVRKRLGLEEVSKLDNYATHIIDSRLIEGGISNIDREIMPLLDKNFIIALQSNPNFRKRTAELGVKKVLATEDIAEVLGAYTRAIGRDIYLKEAVTEAKALVDVMPRGLQSLARDFLNFGIMRRTAEPDRLLSTLLKADFRQLAKAYTGATYRGGLMFNMRSAIQNLSQKALTFTEIGGKYWKKGMVELRRDTKFNRKLLEGSATLSGRTFEGALETSGTLKRVIKGLKEPSIPMTKIQKINSRLSEFGMLFFNMSETGNVGQAFLGGAYKSIDELGGIEKVLSSSKLLDKAIAAGDRAAKITQFSYRNFDLPPAMWTSIGKMMLQYNTYTINLLEYLVSIKQADKWGRLIASANVTNDFFENLAGFSPYDPGEVLTRGTGMGTRGLQFMSSPFTQQLKSGAGMLATEVSGTPEQKAAARKKMLRDMRIMIPGGVAAERIGKVITGEEKPIYAAGLRPRF